MRGKLFIGAASAALMMFSAATAQEADPAGDTSTRATFTVGQALEGVIEPQGEQDWFRMRVEQGQRYRFTLDGVPDENGAAIDPYITIYDTNGNQLAVNDDGGESLNSILFYTPSQSGDVFVAASTFADQGQGRYRLDATASAAPADDVGNDRGTRGAIRAGATVNGEIEYEGDVDWYRLRASTTQRYRVTLNSDTSSSNPLADPYLRVIDRDGNDIATNDDHAGLNSQLEFTPSRNGDVYIEASGLGGSYAGAYTLTVAAEDAPHDGVPGNADTRARLNIGQTINNTIDFTGDTDWYRVRLTEGESYRFTLNASGDPAMRDPFVAIYNSAGEIISADDDGGDGFNSYLEFTAPSTGNYFVEARPFSEDDTGGYALTARAGDIPADANTDISLDAAGDFREGALSPAGDRDWYRVRLDAGQAVRVSLTSDASTPGALADPYLVMYDASGAEVARDDDGGEGLNAWLEYQATAPGDYFIEARGFVEDSEGRYYLQLVAGEIGDSPDGAESLTANGDGRVSTIGQAGDADWFVIELIEARPYRFNVEAVEPNPLGDPFIRLYDSQGQEITTDDDGGTGLNAYLSYASPTGGPVFVAVSGFGDTTGSYSIRAVDTEVPGHVYTDETLDATSDERNSRIEMPGDLDYYRVSLEAGVRYVIEVTGEGDDPLADPFVAIVNEENAVLASDDDSGDGRDARLRFTPTDGGTYYIQASGLARTVGSYRVSIARQ